MRTAIVLRHFVPHTSIISLFDSELGRIKARASLTGTCNRLEKICAGAVVNYTIKNLNEQYTSVELLELINVPFEFARNRLQFLHHLLELCHYFLPLECRTTKNIYELIFFLYSVTDLSFTSHVQKLFLFRFFGLLGICPEDKEFRSSLFYSLITCSLEELTKLHIGSDNERLLDVWLINCVRDHPMVSSFKTVSFLDEVRVL